MAEESKPDLVISRVLDAPLERVWQAWTDRQVLQKWWGPRGVTIPVCTWDAHAGGDIEIVMLAGEELGDLQGSEWPMRGKFTEVVPSKKLVFTSHPLVDGKPVLETVCTVELEGRGNKTNMTLSIVVTETTAEGEGPLAGMNMGWTQAIDKLEESLI